jgi:hypothetical protein
MTTFSGRTVMAVEKKRKEEEIKSMIIEIPSCLKDADGARTRSDQKLTAIHMVLYI